MSDDKTSESAIGTLEVRVFGMQAHAVGSDRLSLVDVSFPVPAADVLTRIANSNPELTGSIASSRLAVNHEFADSQTLIHGGDEVALVGLISGG